MNENFDKPSAIAGAGALSRSVGLPTYSELVAALRKLHADGVTHEVETGIGMMNEATEAAHRAAAILSRVPR